jgi:hypothetical protein
MEAAALRTILELEDSKPLEHRSLFLDYPFLIGRKTGPDHFPDVAAHRLEDGRQPEMGLWRNHLNSREATRPRLFR